MNAGRNYFEQGDLTNALATYSKAVLLVPSDPDVHLNLANTHLASNSALEAVRETEQVLKLDPNSAGAWFVKGSAFARVGNFEEAVKALENARKIDPGVTATSFQLGVARMGLKQWDAAIVAFQEGLALDPNHLHSGAHYLLGQSLLRAGREQEAQEELQQHQANVDAGGAGLAAAFERCKYTQPRVPFKLDQPETESIEMTFVDSTADAFGGNATNYSGPVGIIDPNHTGRNSLFVLERGQGFRLLWNTNGVFVPNHETHPANPQAKYSKALVGDLQNDRFEDVIVLGDKGSHLFKFATNGSAADVSSVSRLASLSALDGVLMDLDFTGKLDLIALTVTNELHLFRQFGPLLFSPVTATSGIPVSLNNGQAVLMEDWNRDDHMDLLVTRRDAPPLLLEKQRGGPLLPREGTNWTGGAIACTGDFDNDLRPDLAVISNTNLTVCFSGGERKEIPLSRNDHFRGLIAIDYDNDGWLDLWAYGERVRVWRNLGLSGFIEQTEQIGIDKLNFGPVAEIHFADFDLDCDSDLVVALDGGGLRYLRNDGGNANAQIKVQLFGNRSNASGLGCKVEIETGGLRLMRTVQQLPVEIGVGKHQALDSFLVHWFNWPQGSAEVPFECSEPILAFEQTIQEGSCPYLYVWDGKNFRFVTDILGAAPLGLPLAQGRYIEADPEEIVWIGHETNFPPRNGRYEVRITEELREVLYLDEAKLVVVDHAPGTEVQSTDKLLPGKPFPTGTIVTLENERPLKRAETLDGVDVTRQLRATDGERVSPPRLRSPQLRGLAEPHGVVLDFGPLDTSKPLVLVLNGWLFFGGGMANIAASHDPGLPFPFPKLEVEIAPGQWKPMDVTVGAPAGKTKTIVADLANRLPKGAHRLRLTQAFEIHWDRIALLEEIESPATRITFVPPSEAQLHFRGFSVLETLPPGWPLTPNYDRVLSNSCWTIIPGGWCTRYGDVMELIQSRDEGLALLNSGDELTLRFPPEALPTKRPGTIRDFFIYIDGWDKDSDFHVAAGSEVGPLPYHGMDDQLYGREKRPAFLSDRLHENYNTRWVEGRVLQTITNDRNAARSNGNQNSPRH